MGKKSKNDAASKSKINMEEPTSMTIEEFRELQGEIAGLAEADVRIEWMESARHGEADIMRALLQSNSSLVHHVGASGNTALHMAAANGHVEVVNLLLHHRHPHVKNEAGNTPLHWAASNGQSDVVKLLTSNKEMQVDVLEKNSFGRSALTEGFTSQDEAVVTSLLEHDSATEDKLLSSSTSKGEHIHEFFDKASPLLIRELAITNADNPFADADRPDQDTTGLSIWAASLVMARWMKTLSCWEGKTVVELGAGCGVPGLAVASVDPGPEQVYLTDLNPKAVENIVHNIQLNNLSKNASAMRTDWSNRDTWPENKVDFVIGSDLIYQKELIPLLTEVILGMVKSGGKFYYVAPDTGRAGLEDFIREMKRLCPHWQEQACPVDYQSNPLADGDDELCYLHFQELTSLTFVLYEFPVGDTTVV